jgi:hypothetical protein
MATLWERISGFNLPFPPPAGDEKIAIHGFAAALSEWHSGQYTRAEVIAMFNIQPGQEAQLDSLKAKFDAATDKRQFERVFKDLTYLAELGLDYTDVADVSTRLDAVP